MPKAAEEARYKCILDAGIIFSAMLRNYHPGSKETLLEKLYGTAEAIFSVKSQDDFDTIHSAFCSWGARTIRNTNGNMASYGQMAKTLNVVLKVAVYYSHLPNCEASEKLLKFLHAAVDTKMMRMLKKEYPHAFEKWPISIAQVNKKEYNQIRCLVDKFIKEKHGGKITPVQFDDIYWLELNRKGRKDG